MGINLVVAETDDDWFEMLQRQPGLGEVHFWAPSAANFRALQPGELFLFNQRHPDPGRDRPSLTRPEFVALKRFFPD